LFFSVALITVLIAVFMVLPAYAEGENLVKNPDLKTFQVLFRVTGGMNHIFRTLELQRSV
jgi:hypothetical protein